MPAAINENEKSLWKKMVARYLRAEPTFPYARVEHLANLLRNRVNSQWNPSLYEVWRQKIVEDIEKQ